jgi:ABC-type sugar transport system ATPase subunit
MVFQSYALYPHMSVRNNIAFGLKMAGMPKDEIDAKVAKAAGKLQPGRTISTAKPGQLVRRAAPARRNRPRHRA